MKTTCGRSGQIRSNKRQYYLVCKVEEVKDEEFLKINWDLTELSGYKNGRGSALPFSATMTELMKTKKK